MNMKSKQLEDKQKTNKKEKPQLNELWYYPLLSAVLAAIIVAVFVCLCYNGEFVFSGMPPLVVWVILTSLLVIAFFCSKIFFGTDNKSATVIGCVMLITLGLNAVALKYLNFSFAVLSLSSLLVVLVLSKKEAFVSMIMSSIIALATIFVYNKYAVDNPDYSLLVTLIIKSLTSLLMIALYKPTYNRLNIVVMGLLGGCLSMFLSFMSNLFISRIVFIESLMNSVWMAVAEIAVALLCLLISPILEWAFRLDTDMQFLQYISFDQPLLKELAEKAPGTFNHSIQVGNLAERCAYAIGENVNVAKAAAYFHDIGKMESPEFFTENQTDNYNPHDDLIFETSVKIITRHTEIGYETLMKHKFPKIICDVAHEHHGDSPLNYFYIKAQNITEGDVDSSDYCYPGPKPTTRISAIIMIADSVEAASRSMNVNDRDALIRLVDKIIKDKREDGQFDNCDITMKQLAIIRDTLVESLVGIAHTRISYPTKK